MFDEEAAPRRPATHEIGQDLSTLSVEDLDRRIALLSGEIERLRQEKAAKQSSVAAADAFFKS